MDDKWLEKLMADLRTCYDAKSKLKIKYYHINIMTTIYLTLCGGVKQISNNYYQQFLR